MKNDLIWDAKDTETGCRDAADVRCGARLIRFSRA